jgi:hypothetical protein
VAIHIPAGLEILPDTFCQYCVSLKQVHIPETLTKVGMNAFSATYALTVIHLPETLQTIAGGGFNSFQKLYIYATTPPSIVASSIRYLPNDSRIYIPHGCMETYLAAANWGNLSAYLVEMDE